MNAGLQFEDAVAAAIAMARSDDDGFVAKVAEIDALFLSSQGTETQKIIDEKIRGPILTALRADSGLFAKFRYASGLVNLPVSPFFLAVAEILAENEQDLTVDEILSVVEAFRRSDKKYEAMQKFVGILELRLAVEESPGVWRALSQLSYGLHMAAYQQGRFVESLVLANISVYQAERANDAVGRLFALGNIGGLLFPALGYWKEGIQFSAQVCREAEALALAAESTGERERALRTVMNTLAHRMDIIAKNGGDLDDVQRLLARIEANPVYLASKDRDWARKAVGDARAYIRSKQ